MQVTVSSRHTEVPAPLREAAIRKVARLERYLSDLDRAEVHFGEEHNPRIVDREICEVWVEGNGHHFRCRVNAPDGFAAIDQAVDKLEHQIRRVKGRS